MKPYDPSNIIAITLAVVVLVMTILIYIRRGRFRFRGLEINFDKSLKSETEKVFTELNNSDLAGKDISEHDLDFKVYQLLRQYHAQGLAQSRISFWFSLVFASIGFVIIVISILLIKTEISFFEQSQAFITLISGTIIDSVSALFFVQSNKARTLMSEFFEKLRTDRKIVESLRLANEIEDIKMKSKLKSLIATKFAGLSLNQEGLDLLFNEK